MRFISYAQNFEDVMLWRALQHIQGGFYIDVGANDPLKDSVTKAFYDRGWHGINVEPVAAHHADLERERPLDINLRCAVGAQEGAIELWECEIPGLGTTDRAVAERHMREGRQGVFYRVPVRTLANVCAEHAGGDIHFLKIDVEGGEEGVLAGADFTRFRPWIIVIEATRPNSREFNHEGWEHLLTSAGYRFAYVDGLNRFYVAQEHGELAQALVYPPNVFDAFKVAQQFNAEREAGQLRQQLAQAEVLVQQHAAKEREAQERMIVFLSRIHAAQATIRDLRDQLAHAGRALRDAYASTSWRITRPIRVLGARLRGRTLPLEWVPPAQASRSRASEDGAWPRLEHLSPREQSLYEEIRKAADQSAKGH